LPTGPRLRPARSTSQHTLGGMSVHSPQSAEPAGSAVHKWVAPLERDQQHEGVQPSTQIAIVADGSSRNAVIGGLHG